MARINLYRDLDWATQFQDGSGQWLQLEELAARPRLAMDASSAPQPRAGNTVPICPLTSMTALLDRRTGTFLSSTFARLSGGTNASGP